MEKKHVITETNSRFFVLRDAYLFDWELLEEKSSGEKVELFLQRNNETKHYSKLIEIEKAYYKISSVPMWSLFILTGLAFFFLTLYLVMNFLAPDSNELLWLLVALLPGILSASGIGVLAILRTRQSLKYASNREERYNSYLSKVQELKNEEVRN
ncbi:MAG: hypothetical protein PHT84_02940 [Candidatus Pacebacteria bacterium]|nr:hypothetical protein [Candidatus Paceibacterota bacterium]